MHALHGHLDDDGRTLVVARHLPVDVEEAWRWVVDRTHAWYGAWTGEGRPGGTIEVTMDAEEGSPAMPMRVEACERPHRLLVRSLGPAPYDWPIELLLGEREGGSTVTLRHLELRGDVPVRDLGPGWELYLDRLAAAVEGREPATFEALVADLGDRYAAL